MLTPTQIQQYQDLTLDIALALGATWATGAAPTDGRCTDYHHQHQKIELAAGKVITLHFDGYGNENRISIYGNYPRFQNGQMIQLHQTEQPTITVSQTRTAAAIARDIERRLIPGFYKALQKCQELIAADDLRVEWCRNTASFFVNKMGCSPSASRSSWQTPAEIKETSVNLYKQNAGTIEISGHSQRVTITRLTSLDLETAADVLALLS